MRCDAVDGRRRIVVGFTVDGWVGECVCVFTCCMRHDGSGRSGIVAVVTGTTAGALCWCW